MRTSNRWNVSAEEGAGAGLLPVQTSMGREVPISGIYLLRYLVYMYCVYIYIIFTITR